MYLTDLADVLRRAGLHVVEQPGWRTRGRGPMSAVQSIMAHHTAGPSTGNLPSLNVLINGTSTTPGPLSHLGLARDGTFHVIAAGRCNHAGVVSHPRYENPRSIGIEAENTGLASDPWPAVQYDAYTRGAAALAAHHQVPVAHVIGHREAARPAGRKIDPTYSGAFKSMSAFRADIARVIEGADMPLNQKDRDDIRTIVRQVVTEHPIVKDVRLTGRDLSHATTLEYLLSLARDNRTLGQQIRDTDPATIVVELEAAGIAEAVADELANRLGRK